MNSNLIWGIRSNKNDGLKGIYRQRWSFSCTAVSQAPTSEGPASDLVRWGQRQIRMVLLTWSLCPWREVVCSKHWFSHIPSKSTRWAQSPLCHPSHASVWVTPPGPGFHKTWDVSDLFFPCLSWVLSKDVTDNCWISHHGSDVRTHSGFHLINDLAAAASCF